MLKNSGWAWFLVSLQTIMHGFITRLFIKTSNLLKLAFRPLIFTFKITSFSEAIHLLSSPISLQLQSLLIILFYKSSIILILLSILVNWCCFHRVRCLRVTWDFRSWQGVSYWCCSPRVTCELWSCWVSTCKSRSPYRCSSAELQAF